MRIGLDAMGGDLGVAEIVAGVKKACADILADDDVIVLVGDQDVIREHLGESHAQIEVQHAPEAIGMGESPVETLKAKPHNSISVMTELHKRGAIDACISAGNTGACVAAAHMMLGTLKGVSRPGISVMAPTPVGPVAICDVGANVNCRPKNLYQYGVMSSLYMQAVAGVQSPRVALLSVGEEEGKGNELVKKTAKLLKSDEELNFIGNVEGRDLFAGACDVMICEGFVGNVVLKLVEGIGSGMMKGILGMVAKALPDQVEKVQQAVASVKKQYDFNLYGGAPLLGVAGIWMICHGATNSTGFANAIGAAKEFGSHQVNEHITEHLSGK